MQRSQAGQAAFKRQVVFRLDVEQWSLLEQAVTEHGSIQAALVAGLQALRAGTQRLAAPEQVEVEQATETEDTTEPSKLESEQEISAREAARILGLKPETVRGYIRSGRLPGHYNHTPGSTGWVTNGAAVTAYQQRIHKAACVRS